MHSLGMVVNKCSWFNTTSMKCKLLVAVVTVCLVSSVVCYIFSLRKSNCNLKIDLDESMRAKLSSQILTVSAKLVKSDRLSGRGVKKQLIIESFQQLNQMLVDFGHKEYAGNPALQSNEITNPDMCQEKYAFKTLSGAFPFFYEGFNIEKCEGVPEFHTLLTLLYNFVHYNDEDFARVPKIITSVNSVYPKLKIIAAIPSSVTFDWQKFNNTEFVKIQTSVAEMEIWGQLIAKVKTKYVYIGRNVVHFTWFDRLERLVREINNLNASVVASASRTFLGGQWTHGCEQSILRNYTLIYREGYDASIEECMLCHHVKGPFVVKTELFTQFPLPRMTPISSFAMWFLEIKKSGKTAVSCPDSMSFIADSSRRSTTKQDWQDIALALQVERLYPSPKELIEFDCLEANTHCSKMKGVLGMALSNCCMKELSHFVKSVMSKCKMEGMLCEVLDGTLLGSVKFKGILPWKRDAEVGLHVHNYTAFEAKLKPYFTGLGYKWESGDGFYSIYSPNWKVGVFAQNKMDSELLIKQAMAPTLVEFDGAYLPAPESPGLFARNRYGQEIYHHTQRYSQTGKQSSLEAYGTNKFVDCPDARHHACLDQFIADGNLMFKKLLP